MIKEITSTSNSYIKELVKLKNSNQKRQLNKFLIEGEDLIEMAYSNNLLDEIILLKQDDRYLDINQIIVPKFILEKLSNNKSTPNMIGVSHYNLDKKKDFNRAVYLDGVQDPGNVGTIIRTSLAFSYDALILSSDSASIYNEKVIQASKGAIFSMNIIENGNLTKLKEQGYDIVVTSLKGAINYLEYTPKDKFILVLGNEGQGVKQENINLASKVVKIDMDNIDSLNVAIAGAILMNHYRK